MFFLKKVVREDILKNFIFFVDRIQKELYYIAEDKMSKNKNKNFVFINGVEVGPEIIIEQFTQSPVKKHPGYYFNLNFVKGGKISIEHHDEKELEENRKKFWEWLELTKKFKNQQKGEIQ